jgi:CrcB protein
MLMSVSDIDPDVDLRVPAQLKELVGHHLQVIAVIAVGGGLGALARYGLAQAMPTHPGQFPWATFVTNVAGCFLIGMLMVFVPRAHRLVRPFVGVGILGGYTTFSTYAVEFDSLLRTGHIGLGFAYLAGTLATATIAVTLGVVVTRALR